MSENLEGMRHKIHGVSKLESVVKTMKILAAANISQYDQAIHALEDYTRAVEMGLSVFFKREIQEDFYETAYEKQNRLNYLVVFGTDQGLVGQFNDVLLRFTEDFLKTLEGECCVWTVGERIHAKLEEAGVSIVNLMEVPHAVKAISPLVGQILIDCEDYRRGEVMAHFYVIYNQLTAGMNYEPVLRQILPLSGEWQASLAKLEWPTKELPEVLGDKATALQALIREAIFIALFRACAHSLASENASRLASMQRAEKNIEDMVDTLGRDIQLLRQKTIDEEIFDVIAGSEDLLD